MTAVATAVLVLGATVLGFAPSASAAPSSNAAGSGSSAGGSAANPAANSAGASAAGPASAPAAPAGSTLGASLVVADPYIISFTPGTPVVATASSHAARAIGVQTVLTNVFPGEVASLTPSQVHALRLDPRVESLEPDAVVTVDAAGDAAPDPLVRADGTPTTQLLAPWGLDRIDQARLPLSNSYTYDRSGRGVKAYVVDTGIAPTQFEFGSRVAAGFSQIRDGRGTTDCDGHGTHVSGTLAGSMYGVAKDATVVPVRVLDCTGSGSVSGVIAGIDWMIADHAAGTPAVANLSLGMSANTFIDNSVRSAVADGITMVVSAGNSQADSCYSSPSRVTEAVTVGATDSSDKKAWFSNYGSCVDLFAPGVSIVSDYLSGSPATLSGTSMAAPHVSGVAALLLEATPTASPATIASSLTSTATTGVLEEIGDRSPNRLLFMGVPLPPAAPATISATLNSSGTATVAWTRSVSAGVTDQVLSITVDGGSPTTVTLPATTSSYVTTSALVPGSSYVFSILARNTIGSSTATTSTALIRRTLPGAPTAVSASVTSGGTGQVTWTKGSDGGSALLDQRVLVYAGTSLVTTIPVSASATSIDIGSLTPGTSYTFAVQGRNALGFSALSTRSSAIVYVTAPSTPSNVVGTLKLGGTARVTWTRPNNGGSPITRYTIRIYGDGVLRSTMFVTNNASTVTSATVSGLIIGPRYSFTVTAENAVGSSAESSSSVSIQRLR